jgi:flagellar basal body-associated protein FliL
MELWLAAVLFFVCVGGVVTAGMRYRKSKKLRFIVLIVVAALLALALLTYSGMTLILVGGDRDAPVAAAIETAVPTPLIATEEPTVTASVVVYDTAKQEIIR